jgi:hypothetical protein
MAAVSVLSIVLGACAAKTQKVIDIPATPVRAEAPIEVAIDRLPIKTLALADVMPLLLSQGVSQEPTCDLAKEFMASDPELLAIPLKVGTKEFRYTEKRGGAVKTFKDPEKEIALRVIDPNTCEKTHVVITKRGDQLIAPKGWDIEVIAQNNGIRWNNWATLYRINNPSGKIVIGNSYPYVEGSGKNRRITNVPYAVPSALLPEVAAAVPEVASALPKVVASAQKSQMDLAVMALQKLRSLGVKSRAIPDVLLADSPIAIPELSAQLIVVEHTDFGNYLWDPEGAINFTLAKIGVNPGRFAALSCNSSGACGPYQITDNEVEVRDKKGKLVATRPGTYTSLRRTYPEAKLITDFKQGAQDPLNAMMLTFLHHDNVLRQLIAEFGPKIIENKQTLLELVGAGYNSGSGRVVDVYRAKLKKGAVDWITALPVCKRKGQPNCMPSETVGYVTKFRSVQEMWPKDDIVLGSNR